MTTYTLKDLGRWETYQPKTRPSGAPDHAMFARRVSDGKDWYELAHDPTTWTSYSVTATLMPTPAGLLVQSVVRDASAIFPAGSHLIEIIGIDPAIEKPHKLFEQQICDIAAGTFTPQLPPVRPLTARQLRLALVGEGISLSSVSAIIAAIADDKARETAQIEWEYATEYRRDHPLIASLGTALNMTEADIDRLWEKAQAL